MYSYKVKWQEEKHGSIFQHVGKKESMLEASKAVQSCLKDIQNKAVWIATEISDRSLVVLSN